MSDTLHRTTALNRGPSSRFFSRNLRDAMHDKLLNILPWNTCNAACEHCFWWSNPNDKTALPHDRVLALIREAEEMFQEPWYLSLSGGELFIFYDKFLEYCQTAKAAGGSVLVVTNCFWARTQEEAIEKLEPLVDAGLIALGVSADQFHEPFIKPERVAIAISAANALGIRTNLHVAATKRHRLWRVLHEFEEFNLWFSEFMESPCLPVGRAADDVEASEFIYASEYPTGTCPAASLTINAKGDGMICCNGVGAFEGMNCGNVNEITLVELRENYEHSPVKEFLESEGPAAALELLPPSQRGNLEEQRYVSVCHLCYEVFRDDARRSAILKRLSGS